MHQNHVLAAFFIVGQKHFVAILTLQAAIPNKENCKAGIINLLLQQTNYHQSGIIKDESLKSGKACILGGMFNMYGTPSDRLTFKIL